MTEHILLCLKCRGRGHDVDHCASKSWASELDWLFSPGREFNGLDTICPDTLEVICSRCQSLDLIELLESHPPWKSQSELSQTFEDGHGCIRNLGRTGSIQFWADCRVCYCLFWITPNPNSPDQEILLLPDWSINRLSGELGAIKMHTPEQRAYGTCLLSALKPSSIPLPSGIVVHRGDALCLLEKDITPERTLGGKRINFHEMNTNVILQWVASCMDRHDEACLSVATKDLEEIRLIDVESRRVVRYPGPECEYVALSYVWGGTRQHPYTLGDTLNALPKTLEDSISFTKSLGKRYLWIDSVCINQSDDEDKAVQINRMWSIYRGAYITVIALSGTSADAGLSRLGRTEHFPQLSCHVKGKTLVSLMPTLSQQIWQSPWGKRAWTLQEGLLSPRCLYISDHQIYFDCSSMQCCESLDETRSWAHGLSPASNPTGEGFVTWMLRQAGGGALRIPLDWPSRRLEHWGEKLNLYSYRTMTYPEDAIRAFDGVLQRLESIYPKGFFMGLPVEDFDWALLWRPQVPLVRRAGFPTWSWAGWKGPLFFGQPVDVKDTRRFSTYLDINALISGQLKQIFATSGDYNTDGDGADVVIPKNPIDEASRVELPAPEFDAQQCLSDEKAGYLFVTAVLLHFIPNFETPRTGVYQAGAYETFSFRINGVQCHIMAESTDCWIPGEWTSSGWSIDQQERKEWSCVLIARDHYHGFIVHHLMLIRMECEQNIARRATVFQLLVPLDRLDILEEFLPRKRQIVLG